MTAHKMIARFKQKTIVLDTAPMNIIDFQADLLPWGHCNLPFLLLSRSLVQLALISGSLSRGIVSSSITSTFSFVWSISSLLGFVLGGGRGGVPINRAAFLLFHEKQRCLCLASGTRLGCFTTTQLTCTSGSRLAVIRGEGLMRAIIMRFEWLVWHQCSVSATLPSLIHTIQHD